MSQAQGTLSGWSSIQFDPYHAIFTGSFPLQLILSAAITFLKVSLFLQVVTISSR